MNTPSTPSPQQPQRSRADLKAIGLGLLIVAAFFLGLIFSGQGDKTSHDPQASVEGAATIYTCSMHPEIRNEGPGKCPICGMDLTPVATDGSDNDGPRTLSLSPRAAALLNVQTTPVQRRAVMRELRLFGRIEPDETRLSYITARFPGRIERLLVNFTGATVEQGTALAELYSPELLAAQQELLQARGGSAQGLIEAAREKLRLWGLSDAQIAQIEEAGRASNTLTLHAAMAGVVLEMDARQGMFVETGQRLYSMADLSWVWVQLEAYETDLPWLRMGQEVTIKVQALPGETFSGRVVFVAPVVNDRTRAARVRVEVANPDLRLRPGMFVRAVIRATPQTDEQPMVIPASAPLITGRRAVVYVQQPDRDRPTYEGRDIVLGPRMEDAFIVESGLDVGELVVTHGNFRIDSELQLRGRISMMTLQGDALPVHDHIDPPAVRLEVPLGFKTRLARFVQHNHALVRALSEDDHVRASQAAGEAKTVLQQVGVDLHPGPALEIWNAARQQMERALARLEASHDLVEQRTHFEVFGQELTRLVEVLGTDGSQPIYQAMCPMVGGRRAYWLQGWKQITNPYWGSAMYECGEITRTLVEAGHEH